MCVSILLFFFFRNRCNFRAEPQRNLWNTWEEQLEFLGIAEKNKVCLFSYSSCGCLLAGKSRCKSQPQTFDGILWKRPQRPAAAATP